MPSHHAHFYRNDIQGIRAIAVLMVMCFHIWPTSIPGGFIGVDIFFVISGFLITGLLIREAEKTATISIPNFYARRIRRLVPMAVLVIAAIFMALPLMPKAFWSETLYHILASTFYIENLWLAFQSVDYLDAENIPGPLQHYWSLSVEEQFYMFWPFVIILACKWNSGKNTPHQIRRHAIYALAFITSVSLIASILLTHSDPSLAYFITITRLWELGLGGLIALKAPSPTKAHLNLVLVFIGLALIVSAAWLITPQSDFPGYLALLPTIGTGLLLIAAPNNLLSTRLLSNRLMKYIGDISYSLYLWHWPIIVFAKYLGWQPDLLSGVALFGLAFLLSALSKPLVEDYFLKSVTWKNSQRRAFLLATVTMGVIVIACTILSLSTRTNKSFSPDDLHPGARNLLSLSPVETLSAIPPLEFVKRDLPDLYARGCHASHAATIPLTPCKAGTKEAAIKIFLIGDSHAAQWWPALKPLAEKNNWEISSYSKSSCAPLDIDTLHDGKTYTACREWAHALEEEIKRATPTIIIYAQATDQRLASGGDQKSQSKIMAEVLKKKWQTWTDRGIKVIAIADTPLLRKNFLECLGTDQDCPPQPRQKTPDPVLEAALLNKHRNIRVLDPNPLICPHDTCPPIIGNIVVWRDTHHITATYAQSFSDIFETEIKAALAE